VENFSKNIGWLPVVETNPWISEYRDTRSLFGVIIGS